MVINYGFFFFLVVLLERIPLKFSPRGVRVTHFILQLNNKRFRSCVTEKSVKIRRRLIFVAQLTYGRVPATGIVRTETVSNPTCRCFSPKRTYTDLRIARVRNARQVCVFGIKSVVNFRCPLIVFRITRGTT